MQSLVPFALVVCWLPFTAGRPPIVNASALEYYFVKETSASTVVEMGCTVTRWEGIDPYGQDGPPAFASVDCPPGFSWETTGWPMDPISVYTMEGEVSLDGQTVDLTSSFIWIQGGYSATLKIVGMAVAVGGSLVLNRPPGAQFPSSYHAPTHRLYDAADAIANRNSASFEHDTHQRDGQPGSNCKDFVFLSTTRVDPPAVTVLACNTSGSWVSQHFHPWGATYIPMSGIACFNTPFTNCVGPGEARWTSPLLRYNETFSVPTDAPAAGAKRVIAAAGFGDTCARPIIMPVTNFDLGHLPEGVPNFVDVPDGGFMAVRPPVIKVKVLRPPTLPATRNPHVGPVRELAVSEVLV